MFKWNLYSGLAPTVQYSLKFPALWWYDQTYRFQNLNDLVKILKKNPSGILYYYYNSLLHKVQLCRDPHQKILFSIIIIVECFKNFSSLSRSFFYKKMYVSFRTKWLLPLFNANEVYNKNKSQNNNESCFDLFDF